MTLSVSGCASIDSLPSIDTIARIESGLALLGDVQVVGVGDSASMNRAAEMHVRNVRCSPAEAVRVVCSYEAARRGSNDDWHEQHRTFVRRQPALGEPSVNGWATEEMSPRSQEGADHRPSLNDLGLWDPPWRPKIRPPDIPPPRDPPK
ncbi:hypothetical protein [Caulobacter flavus]|uniref:hypothetical protein n=1 Tax=Caulobacter flavus TaxID=1679497 RepID=UPI0011AF97B1|nr:hypothetical protein [Caulobacter flavus]